MSVGFLILVHTAFDRAEQVARHFADRDCPVVIHVDKRVDHKTFNDFRTALGDMENILFCDRVLVEWGRWSLVEATQIAASKMLTAFPHVGHVFLASGSCIPLRPVEELVAYLGKKPDTDFIESVLTKEVAWTVDGLEHERFLYRFPFSWKRHRRLFDAYVRLQKRLGRKRKMPEPLTPHLGSQWWCLTRATLEAILHDPLRRRYDKWFKLSWIPDESYFQTLVRKHSARIESRSLTLSKFDNQGKPHIFYDDHLQLLRRSDCFMARKIWPHAKGLYKSFLVPVGEFPSLAEPNPGKIDRVFAKALQVRTQGRPGLYMQSRFPKWEWENGKTAAKYNVFCGFTELFEEFEPWLDKRIGGRVHGHLFAPERVEYAGRVPVFHGCLTDSSSLRDYRPAQFLTNLIWATRGEMQSFMFGPADTQKDVVNLMLHDANARIIVIAGAWTVPLANLGAEPEQIRSQFAHLQATEAKFLKQLKSVHVKAEVQVWSLAHFLDAPLENLQDVLDLAADGTPRLLSELPPMREMSAFPNFLQQLRNQGMKPTIMGDFPIVSSD